MEKTYVLKALVGSHAYGTATETSDRDELRVYLAGPEHYLGLSNAKNSQKLVDGEDVQVYELRHFINLCLQFNPNVITALFVKPEHRLMVNDCGYNLYLNRYLFVSKRVYATFCGYAHSQRSRMLGTVTGQMGEKRKQLKDLYGYDTKYAYHTIRLLRMCHECLQTGELNVFRPDGKQLYEIREGKYSLAEVESLIEREKQLCDEAFVNTKLSNEPESDLVNSLTQKFVFEHCKTFMEKA